MKGAEWPVGGMDVSSVRSTMELVCEKNPNEKVLKERKKNTIARNEEPTLHVHQNWYPECISSKDIDITIQVQKARMLIKITAK